MSSIASRSLVLALVGSGGDGVALLGDIILGHAARQGLFGVMVQSYGPQIRGGESAAVIRLSEEEVQYEGERADVVLCFRLRDLARFQGAIRLHAGSALVLDAADEGSPDVGLVRGARGGLPRRRAARGVVRAGGRVRALATAQGAKGSYRSAEEVMKALKAAK